MYHFFVITNPLIPSICVSPYLLECGGGEKSLYEMLVVDTAIMCWMCMYDTDIAACTDPFFSYQKVHFVYQGKQSM